MRILDRYVAVRFIAALTFANLVLLSIYILANLVENLDKFLDSHATLDQVFRYYLNFVPQIIVIMQPIAILLATLFSLGTLSKNNELMAMRANNRVFRSGGFSLGRVIAIETGVICCMNCFQICQQILNRFAERIVGLIHIRPKGVTTMRGDLVDVQNTGHWRCTIGGDIRMPSLTVVAS